jgi:hypothetical protein
VQHEVSFLPAASRKGSRGVRRARGRPHGTRPSRAVACTLPDHSHRTCCRPSSSREGPACCSLDEVRVVEYT